MGYIWIDLSGRSKEYYMYYSSHMLVCVHVQGVYCSEGHSSVQGGPGSERASVELL